MRSNTSVVVKKSSTMVHLYLLPPIIKLLLAALLFLAICIFGFIYLEIQSVNELQRVNMKRSTLEREVTQEVRLYGESAALIKNKKIMKEQYETLIKAFPPEFKIGDLLANITKIGSAQGLKFIYFKPQATVNNGYYAAAPVEISVVGRFHQIGQFLSGIANLPDSVIVINPLELSHTDSADDLLSLKFTATLYYSLPTSLDNHL